MKAPRRPSPTPAPQRSGSLCTVSHIVKPRSGAGSSTVSSGEAVLSSLGKGLYAPGRLLAAPNNFKRISLFSLIQIFIILSYLFSRWLIFFVWLVFLPKIFMGISWLSFNPKYVHHLWCYKYGWLFGCFLLGCLFIFFVWLVGLLWVFWGCVVYFWQVSSQTALNIPVIYTVYIHIPIIRYCYPGCFTKGKPQGLLHKGVVLLVYMVPQHCYKSSLNSGCVQISSVLVKYWGSVSGDSLNDRMTPYILCSSCTYTHGDFLVWLTRFKFCSSRPSK